MKWKEGGGASFVKLKSGESIVGVFRGEPLDFQQHYIKAENKGYVCNGSGCPRCAEGLKPGFRFRLNFVVNENGKWTPKIFEGGWKFYQKLRHLDEKEFPIDSTIVKISRTGTSTQDTEYHIMPQMNQPMTPTILTELTKVELADLTPRSDTEATAEAS